MRKTVRVVAWFTVLVAVGWSLTAGLDLIMGVQLAPVGEELTAAIIRTAHKVMYMTWGAAFVWLGRTIIRR